jgi:putative peptide zinc metalloprotease protein
VLEARYRELEIRQAADHLKHRVQSGITLEEMAAVEAELALMRERASALVVRSEVSGTFVLPDEQTLHGRYLRQGQLIGYIVSPEHLIVRSVVPQSSIGLVRRQVEKVEVRLAERLDAVVEASILRETPSGSTDLPSRALGVAGGGEIAVRTSDEAGITAAEKVFQLDLSLPDDLRITGLGERAYVRFDHGSESLARQWLRSGRQLVLSRLSF